MKSDKKKNTQEINSKLFAEVVLMEKMDLLVRERKITPIQFLIIRLAIKSMILNNSKRMLLSHSIFEQNGICSKKTFFREIKKIVDEKILVKENTVRKNNSIGTNRYYLGSVFDCDFKINWSKLK